MGIITMGPPGALVLALARDLQTDTFVETGTFLGGTAAWASRHFRRVVTTENASEFHRRARERYAACANVEFVFGHSGERLPEIVSALEGPTIFWLDAHWSGGDTFGADEQCPILDELRAVNRSPHENVILIDDARLFTSPPPPPNDPAQWPTICEIIAALGQGPHPRFSVVDSDVVVSVPERHRELLLRRMAGIAEEARRLTALTRLERATLHAVRRLRSLVPPRSSPGEDVGHSALVAHSAPRPPVRPGGSRGAPPATA
jgi:hypothetical protein